VPRVLLAWEFGGDLGHVRRSLAIARRLRERGHEPLLAFSDTTPLAAAGDHGISWVQAPLLTPLPRRTHRRSTLPTSC
jgi:UDP:flavonoid glycosyltransferase YjiC (YdhE family)